MHKQNRAVRAISTPLLMLNQPKPTDVESSDVGVPQAVLRCRQRIRVEGVLDVWRIDDEWWRDEISRRYFQVALENGSVRTIYQDLVSGAWYEQRY